MDKEAWITRFANRWRKLVDPTHTDRAGAMAESHYGRYKWAPPTAVAELTAAIDSHDRSDIRDRLRSEGPDPNLPGVRPRATDNTQGPSSR